MLLLLTFVEADYWHAQARGQVQSLAHGWRRAKIYQRVCAHSLQTCLLDHTKLTI